MGGEAGGSVCREILEEASRVVGKRVGVKGGKEINCFGEDV